MPSSLVFSDDSGPGITRRRRGKGWCYFSPNGARITDRDEIDRLNAIALPPAYVDCWFCPDPRAHLLAIGFDARGRKQYRYHPEFRQARDDMKFDSLAGFGHALPRIRSRVEKDIAGRTLSRERAMASVIRLLDLGAIRIGNEHYSKVNHSFGATTLRMRHVRVNGPAIRLRYRAKSGKAAEVSLSDRSLARFVRKMQDLPGQHLFQFLTADGDPAPVSSSDVNSYLRETMGSDYTAKHFRTWAASTAALEAIVSREGPVKVGDIATEVAERLCNTPAIARKSYIHPALIELAQDCDRVETLRATHLPRKTQWLSRVERGLLDFLEAESG